MPKPFLSNIDLYFKLIEKIRTWYKLIIKECAPKISQYFTDMTVVINEGNQYEFPSVDIHKAVFAKLILKDE